MNSYQRWHDTAGRPFLLIHSYLPPLVSHCQLPRPILIKAAKLSLQDLVSVGEIEKLCPTRACLALLIKISCDWPYKNELNAIPKHGSAVLELIFVCTSRCAEPMNQTKANVL